MAHVGLAARSTSRITTAETAAAHAVFEAGGSPRAQLEAAREKAAKRVAKAAAK